MPIWKSSRDFRGDPLLNISETRLSYFVPMGQEIWNVLAKYEGLWVAVDNAGKPVAHAQTLPELMRAAKGSPYRLTFLYAAPAPALRS